MRIVARSTLAQFWTSHPETKASLEHWIRITRAANWASASEVMASFPKAKTINKERVRFEVHGGDYRLIVAFNFATSVAFVKFIGAHAEYDRIDARSISLF
jgi:mRNA interferase HigB